MTYLIVQTFVLLLIAAFLGLLLGWYLTRLSAANSESAMHTRLRQSREREAALRGERDVAVTARDSAESERRLLTDEVNRLRALCEGDDAEKERLEAELTACRERLAGSVQGAVPDDYETLQAELEQCRAALAGALEPAAAAVEQEADGAAIASAAAAAASGAMGLIGEPTPRSRAEGEVDDLQQISGIGPKIAGILRELGVRRFEQIAAWTPEEVAAINAQLRFKGRIEREQWIPQAKALLDAQGRG